MNVTVIFGSESGTTKAIAKRIAAGLQAKLLDITAAKTADFEQCDLLVLGSPTYGIGDLQTDWEDRIGTLRNATLTGKRVALFGTGDQATYADSFVDAIGILHDIVVEKGAVIVGHTSIEGYDYVASLAERDGRFVGLALDEDGQSSKTEKRIAAWIDQLVKSESLPITALSA
ncbi:flavodoxin FldA [Magnetospirillum molischianum]|uniref:Flavodoxin n=1 Tax=Magnetospirillum molischianum DSM 120 TaxID=1150626 RepID=H8FQ59_MAGML|nr:flavodoxin FldA [Magnetospirillum molischianum]CCG40497.1 Flavodoxin [Magnetospirillum molischianum DSM 120]